MIELAILLLAIPVFFAFAEWRLGLLLCTCDCHSAGSPEKAYTGPTRFICRVCGNGLCGGLPGGLVRGVPLTPNSIFGSYRQVTVPMWLLLLLIILQAFNSFIRFGNPMITLIGLLTYLLPLPSIVFAYQLVLRGGEARIHQFMKGYLLCIMLALTTVYLEYAGYDWPVLGQVGGNF